MPREIYNEGRVVGASAYEIYVKQHLSEDPTTPPASEREWLASNISIGSSMLLRVPNTSPQLSSSYDNYYVDIQLPSSTRLTAASTVIAQFFDGDAVFNGDWAVRVTDYGTLISNTSGSHPTGELGPTGVVPTQTIGDMQPAKLNQLKDYLKVCDGIVIQPGKWVDWDGPESGSKTPEMDFQANLNGGMYPKIRLHIRGNITTNPLILLTGFTIRSVLAGTTSTDTCLETASPSDSDFLGPAVFPWASKIVFSVPNSYVTYLTGTEYVRSIVSPTLNNHEPYLDTDTVDVKDNPVIDMRATNPRNFYAPDYQPPSDSPEAGLTYQQRMATYTTRASGSYSESKNPRISFNVSHVTLDSEASTSILTVYQRKEMYPASLYGSIIASTGDKYLYPLDCVAPGTIKMFNNQPESVLTQYESDFIGTTAMNRTADGGIQILNNHNKLVDTVKLINRTFTIKSPRNVDVDVNAFQINVNKNAGLALGIGTSVTTGDSTTGLPINPTRLRIDPNPTDVITLTAGNSNNNISWSALLDALTNNRAIDLLGNRLKSAKTTLIRAHNGEDRGPYLEFGPDGSQLRLYISNVAPDPAGVPVGSIGIGWGFLNS